MVRGAPVVVVPGDGGASEVEVGGALAFEGRAEGIELFPAVPVEVAEGVVQLGPMSVLQGTSARGAAVVAGSVDIGELTLSELRIPCSALTFARSGDPREKDHLRHGPRMRRPACPDPCRQYETPEAIDVYARPGGGARVRLSGGSTIVYGIERVGPWMLVSSADDVHLHAQITGWLDHARLTEIEGTVVFTGGTGRAPDSRLGWGSFGRGARPGAYQGPVQVDAGTPVFAHLEGGLPWATVRDGEAEMEAYVDPGSLRAQVLRAPSLPALMNAWVPVGSVHPVLFSRGPGQTSSHAP
jgi:hypothetical protein